MIDYQHLPKEPATNGVHAAPAAQVAGGMGVGEVGGMLPGHGQMWPARG